MVSALHGPDTVPVPGEKRFGFPEPDSSLSVILKLAGETCNINCHYCYEKRKPYESSGQISPELLRRFLALCGNRPLRVELHGGEPLLVRRTRMAMLLAELRAYRGPVSLAIQTNGTLLNDEWLSFFRDEWPDIDIGVSLDGDPEINDAHRVDYRDRGTSAKVEAALRCVAEHGLTVGVISTVTRPVILRPREVIDYFRQFEAIRFLKFSPCFDYNVQTKTSRGNRRSLPLLNPAGPGSPGWAISPAEYADFLIEAFEAWRTGAYQDFLIEPLYSVVLALSGRRASFCHFSDTKCSSVLTLYPDGRIGSCDELRMPDALLAHADQADTIDPLLSMATNPALAASLDRLYDKCNACDYRSTCRGGCLATRLQYQGTAYDDEYCLHRIKIIEHVAAAISRSPAGPGMPGRS